MGEKEHTCCFFGHRKIEVTDELVSRLEEVAEDLITEDEVPEYAGLIYVHATIIGNSRIYYQFQEIKAAPKLHSNKIDEKYFCWIKFFY